MSTKIMHGRREGHQRPSAYYDDTIQRTLMEQGVNPKEVGVLQTNDWTRIQNNLCKYNKEAERQEMRRKERVEMRMKSKELVKHWGNTIEGQRLKKLQARKIREETEEKERRKIDIEEAKLQAERRKEAIIKARQQQYFQTDRVKEFHSALLLTEVLKERDAQVQMKKEKERMKKERDNMFLKAQEKLWEESNNKEKNNKGKKFERNFEVAKFQLHQTQLKTECSVLERENDIEEGKAIKRQCEENEENNKAKRLENRRKKEMLMRTYNNEAVLKKEREEEKRKQGELENCRIRKFVDAKRKMVKTQREMEKECFNNQQQRTEFMCSKLEEESKQKVDDEDDRILKAVNERNAKRLAEEERKEKQRNEDVESIKIHREQMMADTLNSVEKTKHDNFRLLVQRVQEDNNFHAKLMNDKKKQTNKLSALQSHHKDQMLTREKKQVSEKEEQLKTDRRNIEVLVQEEQIFQDYANQLIEEAVNTGRNHFPLNKAVREGPGGGRGPQCAGNAGLRPSYIVTDATGVQLPHYAKDDVTHQQVYGHVGKSGHRLGFTW